MGARRRLAAWIVTGPVGHLYGGVADLTALLARYAYGARARTRSVVSRLAGDDEVERAVGRRAGALNVCTVTVSASAASVVI